ncbi:19178_t:CDS:2 [Entrophospora sp. SA101]|nr:12682_t:CDS:2 [Entrophospora sp. SA101]CAJ0748923.1 19178_t:CDS:2 [Entrophospora sp. SA101]
MAFAGATEDVFQLLKERFPNCTEMEISISFRVPEEIAAMANDFTNYQLIPTEESAIKEKARQISEEENESEEEKAKKIPKLEKKLVVEEIKAKKLKSQIEFILAIISQLDKSASRVILYRKNEIGNWLKTELQDKPLLSGKFNSIEDFLTSLGINWRNIPCFQQIIEQFDQERLLDEERAEESLSQEEINEFIHQIDKQLTEKDIENTGKTILSTIHKAKGLEEEVNLFYTAITRTKKELYLTASCHEDCSRFIKYLDPNLIELLPIDLLSTTTSPSLNQHAIPVGSVVELIGEKGEEEVWQLLANNQKIKLEKLIKNWQEIEDLQIDIYLETPNNIYFIEKILEQQIYRQGKIQENFSSAKTITYLISFSTGELTNDFQNFLINEEISELLATHHDKVHSKTWEAEYNIKRIDE